MRKALFLLAMTPLALFGQMSKVQNAEAMSWDNGGINRADRSEKKLTLVFTSDGYIDGYETIKNTLKKHGIKGAFFFTGNFYRNEDCREVVKGLKKDGHYPTPTNICCGARGISATLCWSTKSNCTRISWTITPKWRVSG